MRRRFKVMAAVTVVAMMMLATTATAFAIGPGGNTPGDLSQVPGHIVSCAGQSNAFDHADAADTPDPAGVGDALAEACE